MHHMETVGGTYYFHGSGAAVNWRHPHILVTSVLTGCRDCNPTARNVAGDAEDCSSMKSYCLIIRPSVGPNFCYPLWSQRQQTDGHCLLYSNVVCHINSYTAPPRNNVRGYTAITMSVCPALSRKYLLNGSTFAVGMLVHHHRMECHAKQMGCHLQGQGHSEGLYIYISKDECFYCSF